MQGVAVLSVGGSPLLPLSADAPFAVVAVAATLRRRDVRHHFGHSSEATDAVETLSKCVHDGAPALDPSFGWFDGAPRGWFDNEEVGCFLGRGGGEGVRGRSLWWEEEQFST